MLESTLVSEAKLRRKQTQWQDTKNIDPRALTNPGVIGESMKNVCHLYLLTLSFMKVEKKTMLNLTLKPKLNKKLILWPKFKESVNMLHNESLLQIFWELTIKCLKCHKCHIYVIRFQVLKLAFHKYTIVQWKP